MGRALYNTCWLEEDNKINNDFRKGVPRLNVIKLRFEREFMTYTIEFDLFLIYRDPRLFIIAVFVRWQLDNYIKIQFVYEWL